MVKSVQNETIARSDQTYSSILEITKEYKDISSFGQIFWREQLKNIQAVPSGRRWTPLLIKWCLYIHHLSSGAYELLRKSNCLALPSSRTLRDYTHYIENRASFNKAVDADMMGLDSLKDHQKFICIVADEMKIKKV